MTLPKDFYIQHIFLWVKYQPRAFIATLSAGDAGQWWADLDKKRWADDFPGKQGWAFWARRQQVGPQRPWLRHRAVCQGRFGQNFRLEVEWLEVTLSLVLMSSTPIYKIMSYILKPQSFYFHIYLMFSSFQTMGSQIEANQARIGSIEERPKKTFQPTSPLTTTQPTSPVITHRRCHFCPSQLFALLHSSRLSISTRISGSPIGTCLQTSAG